LWCELEVVVAVLAYTTIVAEKPWSCGGSRGGEIWHALGESMVRLSAVGICGTVADGQRVVALALWYDTNRGVSE